MSEKRFFTTLANDEYTLIQKKGNPRSTYLKYNEVVDLLNKIQSLENTILSLENEVTRQKNQIKLLNGQFSKIPPKIREVWLND